MGLKGEKERPLHPIIRIEGINPFSSAVAGETILLTLVRSLESLLNSLILVLVYFFLLVYLLFLFENQKRLVYLIVLSLLYCLHLKTQKKISIMAQKKLWGVCNS